ncbi:hypothetical protein BT67DRAFT_455396 [Trichocladium antarcticum]|uniref:Uncharacterized protein n=1 Tax=Trichocladium antarcticum TaxID=1450529 RepID=A0AAN6ULS2_9PEZI|nr:hypothetical protein BT67DRAFT_455396 [Trichocladium antarcticum]
MAILILEPDVNGRAQASIQESAARHAEVGRLLAHVSHDMDMPLLLNPQEEPVPLPCCEPVHETTARTAASRAEAKLASIDGEKGVQVEVMVGCQSFSRHPPCQHRIYHARRLTLQNPETLPALPFPLRPDGRWHFVGPRGEDPQGGDEVDYLPDAFHTEPLAERIDPLLTAVTRDKFKQWSSGWSEWLDFEFEDERNLKPHTVA